ncbi:MAG: hypothetical protein ACREOH_10790 [Candidatus Entotheonellia bacterium]
MYSTSSPETPEPQPRRTKQLVHGIVGSAVIASAAWYCTVTFQSQSLTLAFVVGLLVQSWFLLGATAIKQRGRKSPAATALLIVAQLAAPVSLLLLDCCRLQGIGYVLGAGFSLYFGAALSALLYNTFF